jgi:hypothetical protein
MPKLALIRDFRGEPLCKVWAGTGNGVVFVSSQRAAIANYEGFPPAIGVPIQDAFPYSESAFERLRGKWQRGAKIDAEEWGPTIEAAN